MLFVIFDQRGSVVRFRQWQDALVADLQSQRGGPAPFTYAPQAMAIRPPIRDSTLPRSALESTSRRPHSIGRQ